MLNLNGECGDASILESISKAPSSHTGRFAWWSMEILSPLSALYALFTSCRPSDLSYPTQLLFALYLVHYANRSTISVLRATHGMAPIHLSVWLSGMAFNLANGYLLGSYFATDPVGPGGFALWTYWIGVVLMALGWFGNVGASSLRVRIEIPADTHDCQLTTRSSRICG